MDVNIDEPLYLKITEEFDQLYPGLRNHYSIEEYIQALLRTNKNLPYRIVTSEIAAISGSIVDIYGEKALGAYHKMVLLRLIASFKDISRNIPLPSDIINNYFKLTQRIISKITSEGIEKNCDYYLFSNDKFAKDLGICRLSLIPAGPVLLDSGWMPLKYFLRRGIVPFIKGLILVMKYRSFVPVLKMHTYITNPIVMSCFNEAGWIKFYENVADMMLLAKHYKGVYCAGWFFDPAMDEVSPEISYIPKQIKMLGGDTFCIGSDSGVIKDSTFMNNNRKKLVQEGKYNPTRYVIFIPRKKLIIWRKKAIQ
ncbi:MAG: hypothetical protein JW973_05910 [Bacteroidales bacterium]|nr:hypothetical protein [Bacteroidales bacterium]